VIRVDNGAAASVTAEVKWRVHPNLNRGVVRRLARRGVVGRGPVASCLWMDNSSDGPDGLCEWRNRSKMGAWSVVEVAVDQATTCSMAPVS